MEQVKKETLEKMYNEMTNDEVCEKLHITNPTLMKILRSNNITLKGKGKRKIEVI